MREIVAEVATTLQTKPTNQDYHDVQDDTSVAEVAAIDAMVGEGRQAHLTPYFESHLEVPVRVGDWEIHVNVRLLEGQPVARKIFATPLSVRSRRIFKNGAIRTLREVGFSESDAEVYYLRAWKKKFVWIPEVLQAAFEMCSSFSTATVLDSYALAGDPRRTARMTGVPENPYLTTHQQFLVAVTMARMVIQGRNCVPETPMPAPAVMRLKPVMVPM